ncbi:hypothetical protein D3C81_1808080 [compost metagenome]
MRQAVGPKVQVTIAERHARLADCRGIRGRGCPGLDQSMHRQPLRIVLRGGIEAAQQLLASFIVQDR